MFLKNNVDWPAVLHSFTLAPWCAIRSSVDPGRSLNDFIESVIADHGPKRVMLIRSRDKPWFDAECRRAYELKQRAFSAWRRNRSNEAFLAVSYTHLTLPTKRIV